MNFETTFGDTTYELNLDVENEQVQIGDHQYRFRFERQANGRRLLRIGTRLYKVDDIRFENRIALFSLNGFPCSVEIHDEQDLLMERMGFKTSAEVGQGLLNAPMPGRILEILVQEGDEVELGQPVAILEAMKMENELKAQSGGVVTAVAVDTGDSVEKNELILKIEAIG